MKIVSCLHCGDEVTVPDEVPDNDVFCSEECEGSEKDWDL